MGGVRCVVQQETWVGVQAAMRAVLGGRTEAGDLHATASIELAGRGTCTEGAWRRAV